jgi:hypothetical protein
MARSRANSRRTCRAIRSASFVVEAASRRSTHFFRGIFEWTPGCFTCRDEIRNHRDEPLRPSFVGSNELGIERDQDVQFFPIRDPARQIAALKTAHIT